MLLIRTGGCGVIISLAAGSCVKRACGGVDNCVYTSVTKLGSRPGGGGGGGGGL